MRFQNGANNADFCWLMMKKNTILTSSNPSKINLLLINIYLHITENIVKHELRGGKRILWKPHYEVMEQKQAVNVGKCGLNSFTTLDIHVG